MTKKKRTSFDLGFINGYVCAIAAVVNSHGSNTEHREALEHAGITSARIARAAGVDSFDIRILNPLFKEIKERKKRMAKHYAKLTEGESSYEKN